MNPSATLPTISENARETANAILLGIGAAARIHISEAQAVEVRDLLATAIQSAIDAETAALSDDLARAKRDAEFRRVQWLETLRERDTLTNEARELRATLERIAAYDAPDAHAMIGQARSVLSRYPAR